MTGIEISNFIDTVTVTDNYLILDYIFKGQRYYLYSSYKESLDFNLEKAPD